jgi:hypothetical protein
MRSLSVKVGVLMFCCPLLALAMNPGGCGS